MAWSEGTKGVLSSRFARDRVRGAHRDCTLRATRPEEWLLIEWSEGEATPTKYWLSTMPADTSMETLVRLAKVRWRIERDYEELKQEFGLSHFEGRGWRGFHHHATLCIAAYAFLAAERTRLSPPWESRVPTSTSTTTRFSWSVLRGTSTARSGRSGFRSPGDGSRTTPAGGAEGSRRSPDVYDTVELGSSMRSSMRSLAGANGAAVSSQREPARPGRQYRHRVRHCKSQAGPGTWSQHH